MAKDQHGEDEEFHKFSAATTCLSLTLSRRLVAVGCADGSQFFFKYETVESKQFRLKLLHILNLSDGHPIHSLKVSSLGISYSSSKQSIHVYNLEMLKAEKTLIVSAEGLKGRELLTLEFHEQKHENLLVYTIGVPFQESSNKAKPLPCIMKIYYI